MAESLEAHALAMLFSADFVAPMRDWRTSHGHLDFVQPLYKRVTSESPLALATCWLAVMTMSSNCNRDQPYPLEAVLLSKVIQAILAAIEDPVTSVEDETLTAVVVLTYGEYLRTHRLGQLPPTSWATVHQEGAEALIRKRGELNFRDRPALAAFAATRHNAIHLATNSGPPTKNWDLWNDLEGPVRELCDSYTPATELDSCAITMVALKRQLEQDANDDVARYKVLRQGLLRVLGRLHQWPDRVAPQLQENCSDNASPEVFYLFNEWYLLQLQVSHLLKQVELKIHPSRLSSHLCEIEWIDSILASKDSMLGKGRPGKQHPLFVDQGYDSRSQMNHTDVGRQGDSLTSATKASQPCYDMPLGPRLFGQTLARLEALLTKALGDLTMPAEVSRHYRQAVARAKEDQSALRLRFPSFPR